MSKPLLGLFAAIFLSTIAGAQDTTTSPSSLSSPVWLAGRRLLG